MRKQKKKQSTIDLIDNGSAPAIEVVSIGTPKVKKVKTKKKSTKHEKREAKILKKQNKEPFSFKRACQNFFVKFMRDIIRIKWVGGGVLGSRFFNVLMFIIFFALVYAVVDVVLKLIF